MILNSVCEAETAEQEESYWAQPGPPPTVRGVWSEVAFMGAENVSRISGLKSPRVKDLQLLLWRHESLQAAGSWWRVLQVWSCRSGLNEWEVQAETYPSCSSIREASDWPLDLFCNVTSSPNRQWESLRTIFSLKKNKKQPPESTDELWVLSEVRTRLQSPSETTSRGTYKTWFEDLIEDLKGGGVTSDPDVI